MRYIAAQDTRIILMAFGARWAAVARLDCFLKAVRATAASDQGLGAADPMLMARPRFLAIAQRTVALNLKLGGSSVSICHYDVHQGEHR